MTECFAMPKSDIAGISASYRTQEHKRLDPLCSRKTENRPPSYINVKMPLHDRVLFLIIILYFTQKLLSFKGKNTILRIGKDISLIAHVDNTFKYNLKHNREYKHYGTRTVYSGNRYVAAAQTDGDHHEQRGQR